MFQDRAVEVQWQQHQLKRNFGISQRFLFFSAFFQGLFFWSDVLEQDELSGETKLRLCCLRLILGTSAIYIHVHMYVYTFIDEHMCKRTCIILGGFSLLCCFLVSTGLLLPTQMTIFWANVCYGLPTLAIYYLTRKDLSHWDSLYIVYGLSFFMLPKISPLNFIFGFAGAVLFTLLFIYISAFRLSLHEWLLSNTILLPVTILFMYVSYSSEKSSRERWVLRERLRR